MIIATCSCSDLTHMTIGDGQYVDCNTVDRYISRKPQLHVQLNLHHHGKIQSLDAADIFLSISCYIVPSMVNMTLKANYKPMPHAHISVFRFIFAVMMSRVMSLIETIFPYKLCVVPCTAKLVQFFQKHCISHREIFSFLMDRQEHKSSFKRFSKKITIVSAQV